jgi:hypothetical protein
VPGDTDLGQHCLDCTITISLPFPTTFYGQSFTIATISNKGNILFPSGSAVYNNTCLPTTAFNAAMMAYWDDLRTDDMPGCSAFAGGCGIFTSVSGSAPNRIFNIEWRAVYYNPNTEALNFEVRLYEDYSRIEFIYGSVPQSGSSSTIGTQRGISAQYTQFSCNTSSLSDGLQLTFTQPSCNPTDTPTETSTPVLSATPTATSTPEPVEFVGHVTWQGAPAQPDPKQSQPITLNLMIGDSEFDYTDLSTDASGLFTVEVQYFILPGASWRVKGPRSLANSGTLPMNRLKAEDRRLETKTEQSSILCLQSSTNTEMGLMRGGDANNDNMVSASDFSILKRAFGSTTDLRADFNNDGTVTSQDFNILKGNFGQGGAPPLVLGR